MLGTSILCATVYTEVDSKKQPGSEEGITLGKVTVDVRPRLIEWAIRRADISAASIQRRLPRVDEWLAGIRQPTLRQLEMFAKMTRTPLGYFFLDEAPTEVLPIPQYRTISDAAPAEPTPELLDTVRAMQRRQTWMRDYLIEELAEALPFVDSVTGAMDPREIAGEMRRVLGMERGWAWEYATWEDALRALFRALEGVGILVVANSVVGNNTHRRLKVEEFRGFVLIDAFAPLVFVNGADSKAAQMFTLAHEFAHILLGRAGVFDLHCMQATADPLEVLCNQAAAEFLVPADELKGFWPKAVVEPDPFGLIARTFKVSSLVVARRALDENLIDRERFLKFYSAYLAREKQTAAQRQDGGNFYPTQNYRVGRRFALAVVAATREGRLTYTDAYELTGLRGETFQRYAEYIAGGGAL